MELFDLVESYRRDILKFVRTEFQVEPEPYQREALLAFADPAYSVRKVIMCSSAGVGKSAVLAWGTLWFMLTQGSELSHPKGIMCSMTTANLYDGLHRECAKWIGASGLLKELFEINQKRIAAKGYATTWNTTVRAYNPNADKDEAGRVLSGLHGEYLLYVVDEAGAIIPEIGQSIDQGLGEKQAKFVRLIAAGNPMSKQSLLYKESQDKKNWVFHISSDPDDPMRSQRMSKEWAQEQIDEYGRESTWVKIFVLGQFPDVAMETLLDEKQVDEAMASEIGPDMSRELKVGVDVARFGADANVWFPRRGLYAYMYSVLGEGRTQELYEKTINVINKLGEGIPVVDGTGGYGAGLVDMLSEGGFSPAEINFGSKADDEERFYNKRSEMYWRGAEWVKRGGRLPTCPELKKELTSMLYSFDEKGRYRLESKEQIRKRLGMSPDRADAWALTFAITDSAVAVELDDEDEDELTTEDIYNWGMRG